MMNQKNTEQDKIKNATTASCKYSMHTMSFGVRLTHRGAKTIREKLVAYCEAEGLQYYERKNEWVGTKELIFPGFLAYVPGPSDRIYQRPEREPTEVAEK